jgi:hypothetical protein
MPAPTARSGELSGIRTVTVDAGFETPFLDLEAPPEIIRFRASDAPGDYYQALSAAAAMRLRLLGTLHQRAELAGPSQREAARARLAAQQDQAWKQLQWLMAEMQRLDADS